MRKTLLAACMVIAAFAVVPSLASAKPVLTHPTGTVYCPGGGCLLLGTNVGETVMTIPGGNEVRCSKAVMTGKVSSNSTANGFEGEITSATFAGTGGKQANEPDNECTGFLTPAVTVTSLPMCLEGTKAEDKFELRGGACSVAAKPLTFTLIGTLFGIPLTCKYSRTGSVTGHFSTHPSDLVATVTGEPAFLRTESSESCPAEGKLDMSFTVETDAVGVEPIYASS